MSKKKDQTSFTDNIDVADKELAEIARKIIMIERQCFYGDESERDRLKKIREIISLNRQ